MSTKDRPDRRDYRTHDLFLGLPVGRLQPASTLSRAQRDSHLRRPGRGHLTQAWCSLDLSGAPEDCPVRFAITGGLGTQIWLKFEPRVWRRRDRRRRLYTFGFLTAASTNRHRLSQQISRATFAGC